MRGTNLHWLVKKGLQEVKFEQRERGRKILREDGCRQRKSRCQVLRWKTYVTQTRTSKEARMAWAEKGGG